MEIQVIMYDWSDALVGYIVGDQIFLIWCFIVYHTSFIFLKGKKSQANFGQLSWKVFYVMRCHLTVAGLSSDRVFIFL